MDLTRPPEAGKISPGQVCGLVVAVVLPTSVLYVPSLSVVAGQARQDGWLSLLLATAAAMVVLAAAWQVSMRHPGRTLVQILGIEWGPWAGGAVGLLYFVGILVHGALLLRAFSEALGITVLPTTPALVIAGSQIALCVYAARRGVEVLARIGQVATPLLVFSLLLLFGLAWSDFRLDRIPPLLTTQSSAILRGAVWPLAWLLQAQILMEIAFPFVQGPRGVARPFFSGLAMTGLLLVASLVAAQAVLGVHMASHSVVLMLKLAREVRPIEFLSRTEALYLAFWHMASFVEITAFLHAGAMVGSEVLALRGARVLVAPVGLLMTLAGTLLFRTLGDLVHFTEQVLPVYAILLGGVIPLILLVFSLRARPVGT
ncbi:GerAB/ArcD/ProY family transporter [Limnochorda pilosa]|uniref:Spore germination protein n=1 Tax=Limnochorda pilosa TaxID=1555112 RepID=A0A0K2SHT4_LIMPI|nr:endospore germination permease [Limnochorda pilosa]BAS26653.1 hypothetical protein LIP_0796 [Limnochorda pilosa]